jgi:hypothetical protein
VTLRGVLRRPLALVYWAIMNAAAPIMRWWAGRGTADLPQHHGIRLGNTVPELNQDLYRVRIVQALDLIAENSPRHLVWLRRHYPFLLIASLRGGTRVQRAYEAGILRFSPRLVWGVTIEELALEMVAAAARVRATRGRIRFRDLLDDQRLQVLGVRDRIWFARRLPNGEQLATLWLSRLEQWRAASTLAVTGKVSNGVPAT